jgi:hypothetical protein
MAIPLHGTVSVSSARCGVDWSIPFGQLSTGEPCAGEPHARFGGRGGFGLPDPYVRPRGRHICTVEVRAGVCHGSVAEGNCVAARRGGKQPEANCRSVG